MLCKWQLYRALPVKKVQSIYRWQRLPPKQRAKRVQKWLRIEVEKWRLREVTVQSGWKIAFDKAKVDVEYSDEEDKTICRRNDAPFLPKWMEVKCVVNFEMRRVRSVREQVRLGAIDQCELMELV